MRTSTSSSRRVRSNARATRAHRSRRDEMPTTALSISRSSRWRSAKPRPTNSATQPAIEYREAAPVPTRSANIKHPISNAAKERIHHPAIQYRNFSGRCIKKARIKAMQQRTQTSRAPSTMKKISISKAKQIPLQGRAAAERRQSIHHTFCPCSNTSTRSTKPRVKRRVIYFIMGKTASVMLCFLHQAD